MLRALRHRSFKYSDLSDQHALPMISDCYAVNVDQISVVWINYFTDFPMVRLRGFEVERVRLDFRILDNTFAVRDSVVVYLHGR